MNTKKFRRGFIAAALAGIAALSFAACSAAPTPTTGLESGFGKRAENRTAYFFTYYNPAGDAFWAQILKGGEDAAQLGNLTFTHQTAEGDSATMVNLVQTAIATNPAIIFMPFNEGEAWVDVACQAHDAGIPVIAFTVPAPASAGSGRPPLPADAAAALRAALSDFFRCRGPAAHGQEAREAEHGIDRVAVAIGDVHGHREPGAEDEDAGVYEVKHCAAGPRCPTRASAL